MWDECQSENKKRKAFVQKVGVTGISPEVEKQMLYSTRTVCAVALSREPLGSQSTDDNQDYKR